MVKTRSCAGKVKSTGSPTTTASTSRPTLFIDIPRNPISLEDSVFGQDNEALTPIPDEQKPSHIPHVPNLVSSSSEPNHARPLLPQPSVIRAETHDGIPERTADAYTKPNASVFDSVYGTKLFPCPPKVPENMIVVPNCAEVSDDFILPAAVWRRGPNNQLEMREDVTFGRHVLPPGPVLPAEVIKREMKALAKSKKDVEAYLRRYSEGHSGRDVEMLEVGVDGLVDVDMPPGLGPHGTELNEEDEWEMEQETEVDQSRCRSLESSLDI